MPRETNAQISEGARELLRIARTNDRHGALANNQLFLIALETGGELLAASLLREPGGIARLVESVAPPRNFLELSAFALQAMRKRQDRIYTRGGAPGTPVLSDFDRFVLQAFLESLADLAWPSRDAGDFDGPPLETCTASLAAADPLVFISRFVQHYMADILQYYFAEARIRESIPDLAPETETNLREVDARVVSDHVLAALRNGGDTAEPADILAALRHSLDTL